MGDTPRERGGLPVVDTLRRPKMEEASPQRKYDSDDHETDTSGSDSGDEEDSRDQQLTERLKEAVGDIVCNKNDFTNDEDIERWLEKYDGDLEKHVDHKGNILHQMVDEARDKNENVKHALEVLAMRYPQLLNENRTRDMNQTPVFLAVLHMKPRMVSALIRGLRNSNAAPQDVKESVSRKLVEGETCLHLAIKTKLKESAIQDLLSIAPPDVLGCQDNDGRTPLHHAVKYDDCGAHKRSETVREMLRMATSASLATKDCLGNSLFLYHVETEKKFKEEQKRNEATRREDKENQKRQEMRTESLKLGDKPVDTDEIRPPGQLDDARSTEKQQSRLVKFDPKTDASKRDYRSGIKRGIEVFKSAEKEGRLYSATTTGPDDVSEKGVRPNQGAHREPAPHPLGLHDSETRNASRKSSPKGMRGLDWEKDEERKKIERKKEWLNSRKEEETPAKERKDKSREGKRESKNRGETDKMSSTRLSDRSAKIKKEIKLSCMRKMSPMETSEVIYGDNPEDIQIYFDLPYSPTGVELKTFKTSFKDVSFDPLLQYVAFPSVTIEQKPDPSRLHSTPYNSVGSGKRDMVQFFEWLRETKKVQRIVKVIVDDSREPAHSDEAIVKALNGFDVEELHWLKTDLDPETISLTSGKTVRELYLRWSGNNTVLRGWGELQGLPTLKKLENVYIDLVPELNLESDAQTKKNFQAFKKRLKSYYSNGKHVAETSKGADSINPEPRELTVKLLKSGGLYSLSDRRGDGSVTAGGIARHDQNHQWLDHMDSFAQEVSTIWDHAKELPLPEPLHYLRQPVTVALIDDGVDIIDPSFHGRSYGGQSLSFDLIGENQLKTSQRGHPYYHSKAGHGTVMANMIFRVCPIAKLYIIRIETHRNDEGKSSIVPGSAAKAIETAISKGVNIISMSWTVSAESSRDSPEKKQIAAAVNRAYQEGICMFCTSNDGGHFVKDTYPAFENRDHVLRIGAANADGTPFSWAGSVEELDYILPGVDVVKRKPGYCGGQLLKENIHAMETNTGSSVATALAAGLAAMILTCAKMAAISSFDASKPENFLIDGQAIKSLQRRNNMKAALDNLELTPNKYIQVWKSLDTARFPDSHTSKKLRPLADMALTKFFRAVDLGSK